MGKIILLFFAELVLSVIWLDNCDTGIIYEIIMLIVFCLASVFVKPILTVIKNSAQLHGKSDSEKNGASISYSLVLIALRILFSLSMLALLVCRIVLSVSPAFLFAVKDKIISVHIFISAWCLAFSGINLGFSIGIQASAKNNKVLTVIIAELSVIGIYIILSGNMADYLFSLSNTTVTIPIPEMIGSSISFTFIGYLLFNIFKPRA